MDETIQQRLQPYFEIIQGMGIDLSNYRQVEDLLSAIRYTEARYAEPRSREPELAEKLGIPLTTIQRLKGTRFVAAASRVVLAEFLTDNARSDARQLMFAIYQKYIPVALENVARIASCQMPDGVPKPSYKDQVAAFRELVNNPMANAWLTNAFIGEAPVLDEDEYLGMRAKLLEHRAVLQLDSGADTIEGEITGAVLSANTQSETRSA